VRTSALAFCVALLGASACVPAPAERRANALTDVFGASGPTASARTRSMKLALIPTETTRNTAQHLGAASSMWGGSMIVRDPNSFFAETKAVLTAAFAEVITVADIDEARAKGADVVGALDLYAKIGNVSFQLVVAEAAVAFASPQGEPISTVRGRHSYRMPYPNIGGPRWDMVSSKAVKAFELALSTNAELGAYADRTAPAAKPAQVAAAPAPAPTPAAKSFRSPVEAPAYALPEDASKFALVVGVEKYLSAPEAEHAGRDARAVRAHLRGLGYPDRNIVLLLDQQAGKSGLEKYLDAWLPKNTDEKSTVLFYFSGHGAPNPDDGQAYLMPWDGDPKFLENTGYPVKRLYSALNALKARRVMVAMDACFSGVGGRSVTAKGTRPLVGKIDGGAGVAGRITALTASASDEVTGADEASGHGLFTLQLLDALNARAGKATFKQLFDALSPKVRDAARRDNRDQTPQLIGDGAASL